MGLERRLEGRHQLLKLVEGQAGQIQELRGAGLHIGKPYTGHLWCLLSWEAQYTIIGINSTDSCPETASAFSAANWYRHVGGPVDCEVIEGHSDGATGGPWDTHPGSNRTKFKRCTSKDANRGGHEARISGISVRRAART
jgi:hypothetical protein